MVLAETDSHPLFLSMLNAASMISVSQNRILGGMAFFFPELSLPEIRHLWSGRINHLFSYLIGLLSTHIFLITNTDSFKECVKKHLLYNNRYMILSRCFLWGKTVAFSFDWNLTIRKLYKISFDHPLIVLTKQTEKTINSENQIIGMKTVRQLKKGWPERLRHHSWCLISNC